MQVEMEKWNALNWLCAAFLVINFTLFKNFVLFYMFNFMNTNATQH